MSRFKRARVFWSVLCVVCVVCVWNITASTSAAQTQAAAAVTAANVKFTPADVTVNVGDTVTWTNAEGFHNVVADDGSFHQWRTHNRVYLYSHVCYSGDVSVLLRCPRAARRFRYDWRCSRCWPGIVSCISAKRAPAERARRATALTRADAKQ